MTPVLVSVDKAGDLKIGRRKCRLYKKNEVVKVAKNYGVPNPAKKTVTQLCSSIKNRAKNVNTNNVPLAKLYPNAAKKRTAAKKRAEKKALNKKVATNFMKAMTVRIASPIKPKPSKKAMPLTKQEAINRVTAMKGLNRNAKSKLVNRIRMGVMSPRRIVKVARELSRLNAPSYRV